MDDRIKEHIQRLNRYYLELLDMRRTSIEDFRKDAILRAATERTLHLAIESCINIGNRLISLIQFERPIKAPETYADIFIELRNSGIIESDLADNLVDMARFRNRLVHIYWDIDTDVVYQILQENLDDFRKIQEVVVVYFNRKAEEQSEDTQK